MALTPTTQPTTPVSPVVSIGPVLDARQLQALDRELLLRLERGFHLVAAGAVTVLGPGCWTVRGHGGVYRVVRYGRPERITCDCPDFLRRQRACKHVAAAVILETLSGRGPQAPATAHHVAVPDAAASADTRVDLDARVWLTPLGAAEAAKLPPLWDLLVRDFQRVNAALWRHNARTGHTHHDCAAMRWADRLWRELARALDRELARQNASAA